MSATKAWASLERVNESHARTPSPSILLPELHAHRKHLSNLSSLVHRHKQSNSNRDNRVRTCTQQ